MKYYIGIDLGGTNIAAGVVNENHEIIASASVKTESTRGADPIIADMARVAKEAAEKANISMDDIEWVGVGAPGTCIKSTGVIEYSNNLDWYNVPLVEKLSGLLNKKVFIENDANAAAYGEYVAGSAKDVDISVMVTLGTGVGGGVIINNSIYSGFNDAGAELGHIVIEMNGRPCTCGRKGCFEAYSSATGLIITTKQAMENDKSSLMWEICGGDINKVNGKTSFDAMRKGDKTGKAVVEKYIDELACGITNVINIFQPDLLCIGGGISHEGDNLLKPLTEKVYDEVYTKRGIRNTKIVRAELGNNAGIIGAAMLGNAE